MAKARNRPQGAKRQSPAPVAPAARGPLWQALLLAAGAFLLYAPTWQHGFAGDDSFVIVNNQWTRQGPSALPHVISHSLYFGAVPLNGGLYRPVSGMYYVLIGALGDNSATPFHIATTMLYALNVALVFLFFTHLTSRSSSLPLLATLLFIVHPIHTEVVNNIKSADEMICLAAFLASALAWLRYADTNQRGWWYISLGAYAIAICSKETAVPMVVILPSLWYFFRRRLAWESIVAAAPFLGIALLYLAVRHVVLTNEPQASIVTILNNSLVATDDRSVRLASAFAYLGRYLWMLVWPHPLSFDYSYNAIPLRTFADPFVWIAVAAWAALAAVFVVGVRRRSVEAFAVLWLAASMVIVSNVFFLISTNFGERLLFIPSVVVCYVGARVLFRVARLPESATNVLRSPGVVVPLAILITIAVAAVVARTFEWRDEATLFRADVRKYPNSSRLNTYVGNQYYFEGDNLIARGAAPNAAADDFANAKRYLLRGLAITGQFIEMDAVLGLAEYQLKQCDEALPHLEQSLAFPKYRPLALEMMADCYDALHNHGRALEVFHQIDAEGIEYPHAWFELGNDAAARGDDEASIRYFTKVVAATPENASGRYDLAAAAFRMGNYALSFDAAQQCTGPPVPLAVRTRCLMLAGSSLARMGRTDEAMAYVQQARTLDPMIK
jgi:hypothetical protein